MSDFRTKNIGQLMNRMSKSFLYLDVRKFGAFHIEGLQLVPRLWAENINEGREIIGRIIADIFVARPLGCLTVEVYDSLIYFRFFFEICDERAEILVGSASYYF